jgi:hypothetical protein
MRPDVVVAGEQIAGVQAAGLPPDRAGWAAFAAFHYILGHTIEEQAQIELNERNVWEPELTVDGFTRIMSWRGSYRYPGSPPRCRTPPCPPGASVRDRPCGRPSQLSPRDAASAAWTGRLPGLNS